jgi:methionyl aminopeptidase
MRTAGRLAAEVLDHLTPFIKPGITTREIDRLAAEHMKKQGTISATLGYQPPATRPTRPRCAPRSTTWSATASRTTSR